MIRAAKKEDLPRILELIVELAEFENEPNAVTNTVERMEKDGFGANPIFGSFVAEDPEKGIIGMAIYYYRFSTWKGKRMYLEDLIVTATERGKGIGKALFDAVVAKGKEEKCTGMMWQVLEWNESAIQFYKNYCQATLDEEWTNCSIEFE